MKLVISSIAISTLLATTAYAEDGYYTFTPVDQVEEKECSNTAIVTGIGITVVSSVLLGIGVVATSPIVGPSIAAGTTVGLSAAVSTPIATAATAPTIATAAAITGPTLGVVGYAVTCAYEFATNQEEM